MALEEFKKYRNQLAVEIRRSKKQYYYIYQRPMPKKGLYIMEMYN